jgi:multidrug efflux pump subunit AcrA (membrane-fusion protein)
MVARASSHVNKVALASLPVGVTAVEARATSFNSTRHYVGTLKPWVEAKIGPQLISAYVGSVLVRPGDHVKRGQVIGTLDCRNASAASQGISMQAKAIAAQQVAWRTRQLASPSYRAGDSPRPTRSNESRPTAPAKKRS